MTAVSGILIFITLLLATNLGRLSVSHERSATAECQRELQDVLRQQLQADEQNRRLQQSIAAAETAPSLDKLQADITMLRSRIAQEERRMQGVLARVAALNSEQEKHDAVLGLTGLITSIASALHETEDLHRHESQLHEQAKSLSGHLMSLESALLQLRQREGQIWLIPDKAMTTKEPILVTVGGAKVTVERFDHPDLQVQFRDNDADSGFSAYLRKSHPLDQYVVFLVRPSGIEIFKQLLRDARSADFEVGYDAVEETRQIHFCVPPPLTNETPASPSSLSAYRQERGIPTNASPAGGAASPPSVAKPSNSAGEVSNTNSVPISPMRTPHKDKGWWQRFLEWIGLSR